MTDSTVPALSFYEWNAIFRAILVAKFTRPPVDDLVPSSTLVAAAAVKIRDYLISEEAKIDGAKAYERWRRRMRVSPETEEWAAALEFACQHFNGKWNEWSRDEKEMIAKNLFSPLVVEGANLNQFIEEISSRINE